jgi:hypothetical protein
MLYVCHLWQPYLSVAHISDPAIPVKHLVLKFLMMGTGIYYFFHERDFEEFLIRLHLSYRHFNSLESFLLHDYLFEATIQGEIVQITADDLQEVQGLIHAPNSQRLSREEWLTVAAKNWQDVAVAGIFSGFKLHAIEQVAENEFVIDKSKFNFDVTEQVLSEATLFAREVLKEMNLPQLRKWHAEKQDLILQVRRRSVKPYHYSKEAVPPDLIQDIRQKAYMYLFGGEETESKWDISDRLQDALVYLAWLYANALIQEDSRGYWVVDGNFGFEYDVVEDPFDNNFYEVIFELGLDKYEEQLKAPVGSIPHAEKVNEAYEFINP